MSYFFYLGDLMLPIPPSKVTMKIRNKNKTVDLINDGEVNIIKDAGLTEISFDVMLPNQAYPFASYDNSLSASLTKSLLNRSGEKNEAISFSFKKASYFLDKFKKLKTSKKPFRLIIMRMGWNGYQVLHDTNMKVTLESFTEEESAKEGLDVICNMTFKQYKRYGTKECEVTTDKDGNKSLKVKPIREDDDGTFDKVYKVKNEQSILEVVKAATDGSVDWHDVLENNGISNPSYVPGKGQVILLG